MNNPLHPSQLMVYPYPQLQQVTGYPPFYNWNRIIPEHTGGPERIGERPPHTQHVDWAGLYPDEVILHGPAKREVSLTFDDGPDDQWTPRVMDVLNSFGIKGTFMCVGQRAEQNPQILKRLVREGHIVGNHTWDHPNLTKIPITQVASEIRRTEDLFERLAGVRPAMFRPPYGALNADVINEIIQIGDKIIFWNVDSLDWSGLTGPQVAANILSQVRPGSIILQHSAGGRGESLQDTVNALPYVIDTLRKERYSFLTVPQLINVRPYK